MAHNNPAPREPQKPGEQPDQPPVQPPAPPKRIATPILMSPIDVFSAEKLLTEPLENLSRCLLEGLCTISGSTDLKDLPEREKILGTWVGYWKAKNSFIYKDPVAADMRSYRVYFQFRADMTWNALWLSKFEPEHPAYASLSGKYELESSRLVLHVEALKVKHRWSSNEGSLDDLKFVCDSCEWQDFNDLLIPINFKDQHLLILSNQGSGKVYLLKRKD